MGGGGWGTVSAEHSLVFASREFNFQTLFFSSQSFIFTISDLTAREMAKVPCKIRKITTYKPRLRQSTRELILSLTLYSETSLNYNMKVHRFRNGHGFGSILKIITLESLGIIIYRIFKVFRHLFRWQSQ